VLTWILGQHSNILPLPETHWIARLRVRLAEAWDFGTVHGRFSHLGALDWTEAEFLREFGSHVDDFILSTKEPRLRFIRKLSLEKLGLSHQEIEQMERAGKLSPDPELVAAKNYQVVRSASDAKRRWVDGTPENTFHVFGLSTLFPEAKFIHILREPAEVAKSLMRFSAAGVAGRDHSVEEAFENWMRYVSHAALVEKALGNSKVCRLLYSDMVEDPKRQIGALIEWLGETYEPAMLKPLNERINSSRPNTTLPKTGGQEKAAQELFLHLIRCPVPDPSEPALEKLGQTYQEYVNGMNAAPLEAISQRAKKLIKTFFSKPRYIKSQEQ
jgi:hypothetical protein